MKTVYPPQTKFAGGIINHIPLCIGLFPVSMAQARSSLFSESNFHSPLRMGRLKSLLVRRISTPHGEQTSRIVQLCEGRLTYHTWLPCVFPYLVRSI